MQNKVYILSFFFFISLIFNSFGNEDFSPQKLKNHADSLFQAKNYIDAKILYDDLYFSRNQVSDDLLLKLAYVNEGLKNYEWTLFFLEKYLKNYPDDEKTKGKIFRIAETQHLRGYNSSDLKIILQFLISNQLTILIVLFVIFIVFFMLNISKRNKFIVVVVFLALLVFGTTQILSNESAKKSAIIIAPTLLMDAPSAAGNLINKINPGHKVKIVQTVDLWSKIIFDDGSECYIKTEYLAVI